MTDRSNLPLAGALETTNEDFLELLRMLAHRLSQPLTSLRGSVEVALMGELDASECRRALNLSLQESHRMADALEILRDVLEMEGSLEPVQPVSWTRRVEELLEKSVAVDGTCSLQLARDVQKDVWVKASPQHLDAATTRLIAGALRASRGNRLVRISLSADAETACLSVCEEDASADAGADAATPGPHRDPGTPFLGGFDGLVVRRAIERQGGGLKVSKDSETCCYALTLPLAMPEVARNVLPK